MSFDFCMRRFTALCLLCLSALAPIHMPIAGGPFGISHRIACDTSGIWARQDQRVLMGATFVTVVGGSLAHGDLSKLGDTFWCSLDSISVSSAIA